MDLFAPRKEVHFSTGPDNYYDDVDDNDDSDSAVLTTARSSPIPPAVTESASSASASPLRRDSSDYYPPLPIKSHTSSREQEFELDDDELDDSDGDGPLLEGLLHTTGTRRASSDSRRPKAGDEEQTAGEGLDDEPLPEWLSKGAGVLAGIANMSNSILGAGIVGQSSRPTFFVSIRAHPCPFDWQVCLTRCGKPDLPWGFFCYLYSAS